MTPDPHSRPDGPVGALRAEQVQRWQSGDRAPVEALLQQAATVSDEEALVLIYGEVLLREELGEAPRLEEYLERFPGYAGPLRRQFALHRLLASPDLSATAAPGYSLDGPVPDTGLAPSVPGYEVLRELGRGGMGVVYLARHLRLDRLTALKVIRGEAGAEELRRFRTEAAAAARLDHPNVVRIYEVGEAAGRPFVALEYADGGSLADRLRGDPLPALEAARLLLPLARAVHYAHQRGILHRDLKPANVLLVEEEVSSRDAKEERKERQEENTQGGNNELSLRSLRSSSASLRETLPKIADFGLAKRLDAAGQTSTGAVLGTPSYMAPEQAEGKPVGPAADVYALGAILYECLTGRPPFRADTSLETVRQVVRDDPVPPGRLQPGVPRDLETVCLKCLQKDPRQRYDSADELADDLGRFLAGEPIRARPTPAWERAVKWARRHPTAAALLGACVLAVAGLLTLWAGFTARLHDAKQAADQARAAAVADRDAARRQADRAEEILRVALAAVQEQAEATRAGRKEEIEKGNPGGVLFTLACSYARTSAAFATEDRLTAEDRDRLAERFAAMAVKLLRCAASVKYFDRAENRKELETRPDLDPLRTRSDFREFLAALPE
jgi:eukaryotic-like serine/threonine-protein kinase